MDADWHRRLISGELRGLVPILARSLLLILALPYRLAMQLRNLAYQLGLFPTTRVPVPVVSVGNLTTGGTGKTPVVAWISLWFQEQGRRVAILSRGYGATAGQANDEAQVLEQLCPGIPHLQGRDRIASAQQVIAEKQTQVLVLDDGFQHRRLARSLDIVLIDATNPWGFGYLLPRGLLREPRRALRRADLIWLTRCDQVTAADLHQLRQQVRRFGRVSGWVESRFAATRLINPQGETATWESIRSSRCVAFCGIGNPENFLTTLGSQGIALTQEDWRVYPDHHRYSADDQRELAHWGRLRGAQIALCTRKDLVKLDATVWEGIQILAVDLELVVTAGQDVLFAALERVLSDVRS